MGDFIRPGKTPEMLGDTSFCCLQIRVLGKYPTSTFKRVSIQFEGLPSKSDRVPYESIRRVRD